VTFFAKRRQQMPKPGVEPRNAIHAGAFDFATPGAASSEPQMARFWRSDRGLRAGQRHGMGGQETREIPHASMTRKNRSEGTPVEQSSWPVGALRATGSAQASTKEEERMGPVTETIREQDARREVVVPS